MSVAGICRSCLALSLMKVEYDCLPMLVTVLSFALPRRAQRAPLTQPALPYLAAHIHSCAWLAASVACMHQGLCDHRPT